MSTLRPLRRTGLAAAAVVERVEHEAAKTTADTGPTEPSLVPAVPPPSAGDMQLELATPVPYRRRFSLVRFARRFLHFPRRNGRRPRYIQRGFILLAIATYPWTRDLWRRYTIPDEQAIRNFIYEYFFG